ncbi:DUF3611 family protein [Leptolyngbya sp. FACHB-261]|uniref:DUF3611 family protein n=1 Tax=Leptolyngbya sp. FACHB-261 TaxID=2692806 RepID=UPI001685E327|nr:DUF3611 family protein [Leptolyngbya sp. FACHB-261]MBD2104034.1 DUF3611 family protein [Leptolyngbya sp. FACHB-261]
MPSELGTRPATPRTRGIATVFTMTGWTSFLLQLVLLVISALTLLFSLSGRNLNTESSNSGAGLGIILAVAGLLVLVFSIYWSFQYTRLGKRLKLSNPSMKPKRESVARTLRIGLLINLLGMLLTFLGIEITVVTLLGKSFAQFQPAAFYDPNQFIRAFDIFVVQTNASILAAHLGGTLASLWLFIWVHGQEPVRE